MPISASIRAAAVASVETVLGSAAGRLAASISAGETVRTPIGAASLGFAPGPVFDSTVFDQTIPGPAREVTPGGSPEFPLGFIESGEQG